MVCVNRTLTPSRWRWRRITLPLPLPLAGKRVGVMGSLMIDVCCGPSP
jgi:hypothetical protein